MSDPITLPAVDFPDVIREGCALRLTREVTDDRGRVWAAGAQLTCCGRMFAYVVTEADAPLTDADVVIDLTRPPGQWAVAMWLRGVDPMPNDRAGYPPTDFAIFVLDAITGEADPAELRRVALEVRGG